MGEAVNTVSSKNNPVQQQTVQEITARAFLKAMAARRPPATLKPYQMASFPNGFSFRNGEFYINGQKIEKSVMAKLVEAEGAAMKKYMQRDVKGDTQQEAIDIFTNAAGLDNDMWEVPNQLTKLSEKELGAALAAISMKPADMSFGGLNGVAVSNLSVSEFKSDGQIDLAEVKPSRKGGVALNMMAVIYRLLFK
ncbi:MAG: hypothetical protein V4691_03210 [Pseudomonadota bacterium]